MYNAVADLAEALGAGPMPGTTCGTLRRKFFQPTGTVVRTPEALLSTWTRSRSDEFAAGHRRIECGTHRCHGWTTAAWHVAIAPGKPAQGTYRVSLLTATAEKNHLVLVGVSAFWR